MSNQGFLKESHKDMLLVSDNIDDLFRQMEGYQTPETAKVPGIEGRI